MSFNVKWQLTYASKVQLFLKVILDHIDAFFPILMLVEKFRRHTKRAPAFVSVHEQLFSLPPWEIGDTPSVTSSPPKKERGRSRNSDCNDARISYCVTSPTVRKCIVVLKNRASRQITYLCRWSCNWDVTDSTEMGKWKLFFVDSRKCNCQIYALAGYLNSCQDGKNIWV